MSFVIARQPIYDKEGEIFAYEVYLRRKGDLNRYPSDVPFNKATYILAEILSEFGLEKAGSGKRVFMNVSLDSVLNKTLEILDLSKMGFEIIPSQIEIGSAVYGNVLKKLEELKQKGVVLTLNEKLYSSKYIELFRLSDIVEISVKGFSEEKAEAIKRNGKKLLVNMIETEEEKSQVEPFADYLEGNLLGAPQVIKEFEIAPFLKGTLMRLISALNSADSLKEFAQIIESDVGMAAKLLRFVNSAYFVRRKEIQDIYQACSYIGMDNLKKFILLLATNDYVVVENPELWKRSLIRAIIAEEIAKKINASLKNEAYIAGLFSLIDEILNVDRIEFLKETGVDEKIIKAYTGEEKLLGEILTIAVALEDAYQRGSEALTTIAEEISEQVNIPAIELEIVVNDAVKQAENVIRI